MPAALVVGAGLGGLVAAFRLRRSDWDVVVVEQDPAPADHPVALTGQGYEAARRLGIPCDSPWATLRAKLEIHYGTTVRTREPDRFGVTVTLSTGEALWFDLIVDAEALFGRDSDAVYAAELFGDAFDIFSDFGDATNWWQSHLNRAF